MSILDIDVIHDRESKAMLKEVGRFTSRLMHPAGVELDGLPEQAEIFGKDSVLWDVWKAFRRLDLHQTWIPEELGGMGKIDPLACILMAERLGAADVGMAMGLAASGVPFQYAALFQNADLNGLAAEYCKDHGLSLIGAVPMDPAIAGSGSPGVSAVFRNGEYVLNGEERKVVNAHIGTHAAIKVRVTGNDEPAVAMAVVPLDSPGISRSAPQRKTGQRALNLGSLTFRGVRLSEQFLIRKAQKTLTEIDRLFQSRQLQFTCAAYSGLALSAWEDALKYARGRIQGGVPIIRHKNIQMDLFNMMKKLEAARASVRRMAMSEAKGSSSAPAAYAAAVKAFVTETAAEVASDAIQILGGYGLTKEFPVEKLYRDARMGTIEHGINEDLALLAMEGI